jgi:hypothetical protein
MSDWASITAEQVAAIGAALAAIITAMMVRGKAANDAAAGAARQQAIRPETEAERRASDALERIAEATEQMADRMDRIERQSGLLIERTRGGSSR